MSVSRRLWSSAARPITPIPALGSLTTLLLGRSFSSSPPPTRRPPVAVADLVSQPVQAYISTSRDPFLNLSIEHYLLQKSAPESAVLFLYINRPSVIIGRNQNPWVEVNLPLLKAEEQSRRSPTSIEPPPGIGPVDLVRRRSGGGTVFHDEGNVNWTVISPSAAFTRDKHAEVVVRALRSCGVDRARVNERHDVVLDQGKATSSPDPYDTHRTAYETLQARPLKVSGSAYKLTRQRALHHGTCLLSSPNLTMIPRYLHSPAKAFINARGVESVSSPVGNIGLRTSAFIDAVSLHFQDVYCADRAALTAVEVGDEWLELDGVRRGYDELKSLEWIYLQTPQFELSSEPQAAVHESIRQATSGLPQFNLTARYGIITNIDIGSIPSKELPSLDALVGRRVHGVGSWAEALKPLVGSQIKDSDYSRLVSWLDEMLPPAV